MKGLVHIYCGDGKGKTTAAVGLAVRCAGGGGKVLYVSFMKNSKSGERNILSAIDNIDLIANPEEVKFFKYMSNNEKIEYTNHCRYVMDELKTKIKDGYDLLVMDEIVPAVNNGIIPEYELTEFLDNRPVNTEVVLTGRNPSEQLLERADYVTEMKKIKHPYDKGVLARRYIEI